MFGLKTIEKRGIWKSGLSRHPENLGNEENEENDINEDENIFLNFE